MSNWKNIDYDFFHWGPFVLKTKTPQYIIDRLLDDGLKTKVNYSKNLAGHLDNQFLYSIQTQKWFFNEIHPLVLKYRTGHCFYHNLEDLKLDFASDGLWINFMKPGDYNPIHVHSADLSFVIYLDVPKELTQEQIDYPGTAAKPGSLSFTFTQNARPGWATTGMSILPQTADFIMFPSLLQHAVVPFKSNVTRVSVSGNLKILNRPDRDDYF